MACYPYEEVRQMALSWDYLPFQGPTLKKETAEVMKTWSRSYPATTEPVIVEYQ